jgi:hypothetical protein
MLFIARSDVPISPTRRVMGLKKPRAFLIEREKPRRQASERRVTLAPSHYKNNSELLNQYAG